MKTPLTPAQVTDAPLPAVYEQAKAALAQCETIDECKDWSAALASYAKQAGDETLEKKARLIRNRAIRRMGQVLEQIEPGKTGPKTELNTGDHTQLTRAQAAKQAGLSKHQKVTAQRLAAKGHCPTPSSNPRKRIQGIDRASRAATDFN
ncbi:MAG: hypothetical protein HRU33_20705 [Rhodobacteraceae bacterium]|nr:hypothetical protein [Paracoccaceae bacterium]